MHRRTLFQGTALAALGPMSAWAQTTPPPPVRLLAFDGITPLLGERLGEALRKTASSPVSVEVVSRSTSFESVQARLRQWLTESDAEAVPLTVLPSQHWLGLGLLRPHLSVPHHQFAPLVGLYTLPAAVAVHASVGTRSIEALAERLRQAPHRLPAGVWGWASPSHWLAMLWAHGQQLPLRCQQIPDLGTLGQWLQQGRCAIAFVPPERLNMVDPPSLMPLAAWSREATRPTHRVVSVPALTGTQMQWPEPCFVAALVNQAHASKPSNQDRHALVSEWLRRAMQTESMRHHLNFDGGHDLSSISLPALQAAADGQRRAFEALPVQRLEGGRS